MSTTWPLRSPFNFPLSPPTTAPQVCDVTLRDGEQTVDVAFTVSEKADVIAQLEQAGVTRAQVGFTGNRDDREAVRRARERGLSIQLELLCVAVSESWREEIDESVAAGADVIQVLVRGSDEVLEVMGLSRGFILQRVHEVTTYVASLGVRHIAVGPSFTTVSDLEFLLEIYRTGAAAGATELVINDTLGVARPSAMRFLVEYLRERFDGSIIRVHCHNDFGLAVACALEAWEAGAGAVDVAVNGLGERAGNVPIDEFVMALELLYGVQTPIRKASLTPLAEYMAELLGRDIHPNKPIVGRNCFAQQIEMHIRYASGHPHLFEPFPPAEAGGTRVFALGKGSGSFAITEKARLLGLPPLSDADIADLVIWVNREAERTKRVVADDAFAARVQVLS